MKKRLLLLLLIIFILGCNQPIYSDEEPVYEVNRDIEGIPPSEPEPLPTPPIREKLPLPGEKTDSNKKEGGVTTDIPPLPILPNSGGTEGLPTLP